MYWNHRVVLVHEPDGDDDEPFFEICEVYYNEKNEPCGYSEATASSETLEGLNEYIQRMADAIKAPVLRQSDFVGRFTDEELH